MKIIVREWEGKLRELVKDGVKSLDAFNKNLEILIYAEIQISDDEQYDIELKQFVMFEREVTLILTEVLSSIASKEIEDFMFSHYLENFEAEDKAKVTSGKARGVKR